MKLISIIFRILKADKKGFTLVDLIIAMSIFSAMTLLVTVNFNSGTRNDSVRQTATIASVVLRKAQSQTLTGAVLSNGTFPIGGYGVRFDDTRPGEVTLFADIDGNLNYTDSSEDLETILFSKDAVFSVSTLNVLFSSPNADVYFNGLSTDPSKTITITAPDAHANRSVIIYRLSGQVRVE
jgi:type II secretory pathway pseudopilin PulG